MMSSRGNDLGEARHDEGEEGDELVAVLAEAEGLGFRV